MIDRQHLLADLTPLLRVLETDLRARCDEVPQINADLTREYEQARAADRTGVAFEEWRADLITQVAVAWVLSCVFVRFLEDNALIAPPRISGPLHGGGDAGGLMRARDERESYFKSHPKLTDRDYLLSIFDDLATLPGAGVKEVFGPHNPATAPGTYRHWLSGDAAQKLIDFFQKIDADGSGELLHDFTDPTWDTRFLGDLYQDLSEAARKKYALLQTPIFVEEFILERTLEPAIKEFGLRPTPGPGASAPDSVFKMIDPACGSGHFLLGSFARILNHWRAAEPATNDRELVNRTLASIHGVDLNPYAIAIARFRLLLSAMRECHIARLKDAPAFHFNLVCGDSLLHGSPGAEQHLLGFHELAHAYQSEDLPELQRILTPGRYHAVVANPPYITVKDKALNQAYRERYPEVCHMKYSLSVPFLQRIFLLACTSGFTGQITANSFMKREFGKKLIEGYLPQVDLTHVIDTAGAYIPGHGTPTVILFGRTRRPVAASLRAVMGIRGEPATPDDPAKGHVWSAIAEQIDRPGSQSDFVSVADAPRQNFLRHPWSIGGGGASELKELLDEQPQMLMNVIDRMAISVVTLEDDAFVADPLVLKRKKNPRQHTIQFVEGDVVREWRVEGNLSAIFPYDWTSFEPSLDDQSQRNLWAIRTTLKNRMWFRKTQEERRMQWFEYGLLASFLLRAGQSIVFAEMASHNHFALDRGGRIHKNSAHVIKLAASANEDDHLVLLGLLNSSIACFWMKQVAHQKQMMGGDGIRISDKCKVPYAFSATMLERLPIPSAWSSGTLRERLLVLTKAMDSYVQQLDSFSARAVLDGDLTSHQEITDRWRGFQQKNRQIRSAMIFLQEEIDFVCYAIFDLCDSELIGKQASPPDTLIDAGDRPFSIVAQSDPFGFEVPKDIPIAWPAELKGLWQRRMNAIRNSPELKLVEDPHYKRRWIGRQGLFNHQRSGDELRDACKDWLVQRAESYFDLDGRMNDRKKPTVRGDLREPRLTSAAKLADLARADKEFMQVASLFADRVDFDVAKLVGELVAAESVPALPVLRYKLAAMDKRAAWERTWELQRQEDAVDALFEDLIAKARRNEAIKITVSDPTLRAKIEDDLNQAARYLADAVKQRAEMTSEVVLKEVRDAAKRAKKAAVGDIAVPPKYTSADFLSGDVWRLRGKLDVPKERWVSFPYCEGEDTTAVIAWAGYDHLQLARAIAERYEHAKEQEGRKLEPLLAAIGQLVPWLKQWHNEVDAEFGTRMGDYFAGYLAEECKALGKSVEDVMNWRPAERAKKGKKAAKANSPGNAGPDMETKGD